jgi:hypothetical protein
MPTKSPYHSAPLHGMKEMNKSKRFIPIWLNEYSEFELTSCGNFFLIIPVRCHDRGGVFGKTSHNFVPVSETAS